MDPLDHVEDFSRNPDLVVQVAPEGSEEVTTGRVDDVGVKLDLLVFVPFHFSRRYLTPECRL